MSLIRLLAAGSSLKGIKDQRSPYKMMQQHLLPKFNADKQAEASNAGEPLPPAAMEMPCLAEEHRKSKGTQVVGIEAVEAETLGNADGISVPSPGLAARQAQSARKRQEKDEEREKVALPGGSSVGAIVGGLTARTSFWGWAKGKNPFRPKPAVRKRPPPVQGELLLESVKVVRNDLNEADLEVVPANAEPRLPPASPSKAEPARRSWRRIGTRLFGIGKL